MSQSALAQQDPRGPDLSTMRIRIGPLWINPTLALTNAGVDTNVFNESDVDTPKRDFTVTITPQADLWLRAGRTWLNGAIREDIVYYHKYSSERSVNNDYKLAWQVPLNRLILNVDAQYLNTRDRPGFEIDARSQRVDTTFSGRVEVRALAKTFVGLRGQRMKVAFDKDAAFLGTNLQFELNRVVTTTAVTVRHQLTPLTAVSLDFARAKDRFQFSPLRDSRSTQIAGSVRFDPFALIKGGASLGYRHFKPVLPGLPEFKGSTMTLDLAYTAFGATRFSVQGLRDVQYSFEINQPYYVQTGATLSLAQQLFGPVDVVGRFGAHRLAYRDREGVIAAVSDRIDHVRSYGIGVGYHLGQDLRLGFNVDHQKRTSGISGREYGGLRYGIALTYGF